ASFAATVASLVLFACGGGPGCGAAAKTAGPGRTCGALATAPDGGGPGPFRVLLFSRTAAYRHDSIPAATTALMGLQASGDYIADATEDATCFGAAVLGGYQVVVF